MTAPLVRGPWRLTDLANVPKNDLRIMSTFSCAGGSTMGYKLAGYQVVGCVEIDPEMAAIYKANHDPKHLFQLPIQDFNRLTDNEIPADLLDLDILDGSPPCSVFSLSGKREDGWGKEKSFREGQAVQRLDDLFFHFIATAKKLRPRIVIAENVVGLVIGKAKGYVKEIVQALADAGYETQIFRLNASRMGVPQTRERIFFLARRTDLKLPPIRLDFNEQPISLRNALAGLPDQTDYKPLSPATLELWRRVRPGDNFSTIHPKAMRWNWYRLGWDRPFPTIASASAKGMLLHPIEPRGMSVGEIIRGQSFPDDFDFGSTDPFYVMGMSVPPLMMQRIADQVERQWLFSFRKNRAHAA